MGFTRLTESELADYRRWAIALAAERLDIDVGGLPPDQRMAAIAATEPEAAETLQRHLQAYEAWMVGGRAYERKLVANEPAEAENQAFVALILARIATQDEVDAVLKRHAANRATTTPALAPGETN